MTKNLVEKAWAESYEIERIQEVTRKDTFIDSITHIVNCIEKDGLTVKQALEVLDGVKEVILWSGVGNTIVE